MKTVSESNNVKVVTEYFVENNNTQLDRVCMYTEDRMCTIRRSRFSGKYSIQLAKMNVVYKGCEEWKNTKLYLELDAKEAFEMWDKKMLQYGYDYKNEIQIL